MRIKADNRTRANWARFHRIVGDFKYSYGSTNGIVEYSLDEKLMHSGTITMNSRSKVINAEGLILIIGEEAFKSLIENIWDVELYFGNINPDNGLAGLLQGFNWFRSRQGADYWDNIEDKLIEYSHNI